MTEQNKVAVQLSQEECSKMVEDNALSYIEKGASDLVEIARQYNTDLRACEGQSLGVPSPEVNKAWASGDKFWKAFVAYSSPQNVSAR